MRIAVTALAVMTASAAAVGAEPLALNRPYLCDGRRIVVQTCRSETADAVCRVFHLDRTGSEPPTSMETRGALTQRLQSCRLAQPPPRQDPAAGAVSQPCADMRRVGAAASQGFRPIDTGLQKHDSFLGDTHGVSVSISGAAGCTINRQSGEPAEYSCVWPAGSGTEANWASLARSVGRCVSAEPRQSDPEASLSPEATVRSAGVLYTIKLIGVTGNRSFLSLDVKADPTPAQSRPAAAPAP